MRVTCVGGGPAGLYFAILAKRRFPDWSIRVLERNRPLDTFGWGVVFSDATLENLRAADEPTQRRHHASLRALGRHRHSLQRAHDSRRAATASAASRESDCWRFFRSAQPRSASSSAFKPTSKTSKPSARLRSARRRRRHQQPRARHVCRDVQARSRHAALPLRLARNDAAARCVYVYLRAHRARLVHRARLPLRRRARAPSSSSAARKRGSRTASTPPVRSETIAFCENALCAISARTPPHDQLGASARPRLAELHPRQQRALGSRQRRADGRRRAHRALLGRLGNEARDGRCDRPRRRARNRERAAWSQP